MNVPYKTSNYNAEEIKTMNAMSNKSELMLSANCTKSKVIKRAENVTTIQNSIKHRKVNVLFYDLKAENVFIYFVTFCT